MTHLCKISQILFLNIGCYMLLYSYLQALSCSAYIATIILILVIVNYRCNIFITLIIYFSREYYGEEAAYPYISWSLRQYVNSLKFSHTRKNLFSKCTNFKNPQYTEINRVVIYLLGFTSNIFPIIKEKQIAIFVISMTLLLHSVVRLGLRIFIIS